MEAESTLQEHTWNKRQDKCLEDDAENVTKGHGPA